MTINLPAIFGQTKRRTGIRSATHGHIRFKEVKKVGLGFINNWGGKTVTLLVNSFSVDGEGIKPLAVHPKGKLTTKWGELKTSEH